jgi:hypothetical protein
MSRARNWSKNFRKFLRTVSFGITYSLSFVTFKRAVVDHHIGNALSINSSALKVACPPPGIRNWSKILREFFGRKSLQLVAAVLLTLEACPFLIVTS